MGGRTRGKKRERKGREEGWEGEKKREFLEEDGRERKGGRREREIEIEMEIEIDSESVS